MDRLHLATEILPHFSHASRAHGRKDFVGTEFVDVGAVESADMGEFFLRPLFRRPQVMNPFTQEFQ